MKIISAYLLETTSLSKEEAATSSAQIDAALKEWLVEKGVVDPIATSGTFTSKTKGSPVGIFQRRSARSTIGAFDEIALQEPTSSGQRFVTTIGLLTLADRVTVYTTLVVQNVTVVVAPIFTDPRCPTIVKRLLDLRSDWQLGGATLPRPIAERISGREEGGILASAIKDPARTLPVVVVSEIESEPIWADLEKLLAADLAGLARVVRIDEDASWALSDELGKLNSCYLGAIRLYWPRGRDLDGLHKPRSSVWTAGHMLSQDSDGKGMQRIRALLRGRVMGVASLTIEPPAAIREIQNQAARAKLSELEQRANSNSEEIELARLFIHENEDLKERLDEATREITRQASRADAAEYALSRIKERGGLDESRDEDLSDDSSPGSGEIRYYKKTQNTPSHDVLVRVKDCEHNKWQGASSADKARKGVERLEGTSAWKNIYHCAKCTGGGLWKVVW